MDLRRGLGVAVATSLLLAIGACGPMEGVTAGPQVSPVTGEEYPEGVPPRDTQYATMANIAFVQAEAAEDEAEAQRRFREGLEAAQEGIESDPENPLHHYLAGVGFASLGEYREADAAFVRAEELFPAYELEIDPTREQAWIMAFNEGIEAYNAGDLDAAVRHWEQANVIYDKRPDSYQNIAVVAMQAGDYDRAIEAYRGALEAAERRPVRELEEGEAEQRVEARSEAAATLGELLVFRERFDEAIGVYEGYLEDHPDDIRARGNLAMALARQGRQAEARQMFDELLANPDIAGDDLFQLGVALYQAGEEELSGQAFERVTTTNPNSRDAWWNYLNVVYAQEDWQRIIPLGERVLELDPLNQNAHFILAQAYRQDEQRTEALRILEANEVLPVVVDELRMQPAPDGGAQVQGQLIGHAASQGTPIQLRFTFYNEGRELGSETVTVSAPAAEQATGFQVQFESTDRVTGYRYELVG
jgi:tetratricopeptide (TPR) repeat protein